MRRVRRHIEIDRDPPGLATASVVAGDHGVGQRLGQPVERAARRRLLEARHGRLRGQPQTVDRIAVEQQFVNRILGERIAIVAIRVATGDAKHALGDQVADRVRDLRRVPAVRQRGGQRLDDAEPTVHRLQQHRAAVGAGVRLVERRDQGLLEQIGKQNTVWYGRVVQRSRLRLGKSRLINSLVPTRRRLCFSETRSLVNYPG